MSALDTVKSWLPARRQRGRHEVVRYTLQDYFRQTADWFRFGNTTYGLGSYGITTTYQANPAEPIGNSYEGYAAGLLYSDGPVSAALAYRLRVFSQAPLLFQSRDNGRPGDLYDDASLDLLRRPWTSGTSSDLMKRALVHGDLGGNAYLVVIEDEVVPLRPDWVEILLAKRMYDGYQVGWKQVGIAYYEGGAAQTSDPAVFLPGEYAHFIPGLPDPLATWRGMSWLTPVIREIQADKQASDHKLKFFENAATPNLAVSLPKEITPDQYRAFVDKMEASHRGVDNAYRTLYTGGGADVTVVGANMQQMDFTGVQGKIETRIANAAGVSPVLLSFSEGMQGSSLNAGNYTPAKRNFVDTTMRDLWGNWCGSLQTLFPPPNAGDRLTYDPRDIPFLHEDQTDVAQIKQIEAATMNALVTAGWEKASIVAALTAGDWTLLKDTGLVSVQLLPPGTTAEPAGGGAAPKATAARAAVVRKYNPEQPRIHSGHEGGGRWTSGMPGAIVTLLLKVAGGDVEMSAPHDRPGHADLFFGGHSLDMTDAEIEILRRRFVDAEYGDGQSEFIRGGRINPVGPLRNQDGEEVYREFDLVIHGKDGNDAAKIRLSDKDVDKLVDRLNLATEARRQDSGYGPLDVFAPRPGAIGFRMKDDAGKPTEVTFNSGEWNRINDAFNILIEGYDESKIPANAPDNYEPPLVERLVVKTAAGPVELKWRGGHPVHGYDPNAVLTITPLYDAKWSIAVDGAHMSDVFHGWGMVASVAGLERSMARAAGHDVTPGHDELHHYWTVGEGLAKWHDFTSLYDHLVKYVGPLRAKRMAAEWFHERFGFWPGSDKNRLMHGKKPRGDRVGPG